MTRYARGKPTHQRVAKDSTPWDELKEIPVKSKDSRKRKSQKKNANVIVAEVAEDQDHQSLPVKKYKKQKHQAESEEIPTPAISSLTESEPVAETTGENANRKEAADKKKHRRNTNVKGFGDSKLVKIFGQFWVPAEDAKRLQKLVTSMKEKGLSRKEISNAVQNERRRAEKAGKRIRDKTCFNCRQFGHVLNDCPKIAGNDSGKQIGSGTEICFKCGSTEHSSRHCRKQEDKFDFAKCFICSETGHISRQCPKNKRGIYPSGGSCNQCGEFTHLAKDCTKFVMSSANSEPVATRPKFPESDLPSTGRIANPYSSTEYEDVTTKSNNFVLKGKFNNQTSKSLKIKF